MATHHHQTRVPSPTHAPFIPTADCTPIEPDEFADLLADEAAVIARCARRPDPIETVAGVAGLLAVYAVTRAMSGRLAAALIADPFIAPPRQDLPHIVCELTARIGTVFPEGFAADDVRPAFEIVSHWGLVLRADKAPARLAGTFSAQLAAALGYAGSTLTARKLGGA